MYQLKKKFKQGVFTTTDCSIKTVNHAVTVVGYGTSGGLDYWLVRNSWGTWGEAGYIRMARNKSNMCGIATYGFYPTV